jgi:poly-gamma-glutamate synthesis protein (capsule biosynthesis protein)
VNATINFGQKILTAVFFTVTVFVVTAPAAALLFTDCTVPKVPEEHPLPEAEKPQSTNITFIAAGDNLIHDIIYNRARVKVGEDTFNFDPGYDYIRPIIKRADIAFVNQETVLGGKQFGYSGYPVFNTPQDAGLGLINTGFNVINQASNHTMDRGEGAVYGTMDFWDSKNILYLGIFRSEEQRKTEKRIMEKNGIIAGFLSYTYGLNGFHLPHDKPWLVGIIDKETMAREINELRPLCDLLVVSMHWGNEFRHTVSGDQKQLAVFMADHKVDVVIGHHPHVTGPVEVISRPDGGKLTLYYSLGDFLSHTQADSTPDTMTGALAYMTITKTFTKEQSSCTVTTAGVIPTVCHYSSQRTEPFLVYPLWDYTDDLAAKHIKKNITVKYLNSVARNIFGSRIIEKEYYGN